VFAVRDKVVCLLKVFTVDAVDIGINAPCPGITLKLL
jgi:hypothetical protein